MERFKLKSKNQEIEAIYFGNSKRCWRGDFYSQKDFDTKNPAHISIMSSQKGAIIIGLEIDFVELKNFAYDVSSECLIIIFKPFEGPRTSVQKLTLLRVPKSIKKIEIRDSREE